MIPWSQSSKRQRHGVPQSLKLFSCAGNNSGKMRNQTYQVRPSRIHPAHVIIAYLYRKELDQSEQKENSHPQHRNQQRKSYFGFQVLTSVVMKSTVFWHITPCKNKKAKLSL
jgi:hypothetical protein